MMLGLSGAVMAAGGRNYHFDGSISREVLESYLSRAITMASLCGHNSDLAESVRMLRHIGAKFVGRSIYRWGGESRLNKGFLDEGRTMADAIHAADPDIILQAGIFEIVTAQVNEVPVPDWVFTEFGLPIEKRNFRYARMIYRDGRWVNLWGKDASVPDSTRLEAQMWYYFLARSYIDIGIESLHFGQFKLVTANDPTCEKTWQLLSRIRRYAKKHARRHLVLCDAHISSGIGCYGLKPDPPGSPLGPAYGEQLLLDFHALPLRIREIPNQPHKAELAMGHLDALYGRSRGGITPSGWRCKHLPFLVEFDNYGTSGHPGQSAKGQVGNLVGINDAFWIWGWDEICWFAHQTEPDRNAWLKYAWHWVRQHDPNGFVEMPGMRGLADPVDGIKLYRANTRSPACPTGFNQEETIKTIWAEDDQVKDKGGTPDRH